MTRQHIIGLRFLGKTMVYPRSGARLTFVVTKHRVVRLDKEYERCSEGYDMSGWLRCIRRAYRDRVDCIFPWDAEDMSVIRSCTVYTAFKEICT